MSSSMPSAWRRTGTICWRGWIARNKKFAWRWIGRTCCAKGLTMRAGQCDVHKYLPKLLDHIQNGDFDTTGIITHHMSLDEAPHAYQIFCDKEEGCVKVVLKP